MQNYQLWQHVQLSRSVFSVTARPTEQICFQCDSTSNWADLFSVWQHVQLSRSVSVWLHVKLSRSVSGWQHVQLSRSLSVWLHVHQSRSVSVWQPLNWADLTQRSPYWPCGQGLRPDRRRPRFNSPFHPWSYSRSGHSSDFRIATPVATLLAATRYRVNAVTGWPGVRKLWLGETESLICSLCLIVGARTFVWADTPLRYSRMLLGR